MAELHAHLRAPERAEAAVWDALPWELPLPAVPVSFEDITVHFSKQEWASLDDGQKELYRTVMEGNYETLVSLYCALFKPELLFRLERGEELCVPAESDLKAADVSPEPAAEPGCLSNDSLLEQVTKESCEENCRDLKESRSLAMTADCIAPHIPHEATAIPADLSQPTLLPSCPVPTRCHEEVNPSWSPAPPPAAADANVGVPMEVPQEEVVAEKQAVPVTPSKGLEEEDTKDSGNGGQGLVADVPNELVKEAIPDVRRTMPQADPSCTITSPRKPIESPCVGRTATCQRNSTREKSYSCPVCRKNFLLKINLIIHQRNHRNSVPYVCTHCGCNFMSKKKIRRHLRFWASKGFCQPLEGEQCPGRAVGPASQPCTQSSTMWQVPNPNQYPLSPGVMYTCNLCAENYSSQRFLVLRQHRLTTA
ncbi:zinc finger protein 398-like [Falco biarmicus]|uniref:zinc finger protein 777-like n=1 Tax=Falco rusticolus TaxID=120794 RepID=UPI0018869703|nr:zinc finger protein 777-like [Falco rusticolus]XP_056190003.1 zinc finger protein 398-like [Falco biarmicus]